jgi:hypothetical protein
VLTFRTRDEIRDWKAGPATRPRRLRAKANELLNRLHVRNELPALAFKTPCEAEGPVDQRRRAFRELTGPRAERLAATFRPILRFAPGERWRPLEIDRFLAERRAGAGIHQLCAPGCEELDVAALAAAHGGHLDLDGSALSGGDYRTPDRGICPAPQRPELLDCDGGERSAIYYRVVEANDRRYVDFWWFLRFNGLQPVKTETACRDDAVNKVCPEHEGDWEGVTVVTREGGDDLEYVDYAQHDGVYRRLVRDPETVDGRPIVYVARDSHAGYPLDCKRSCRGFVLSALEGPTGRIEWARNDDSACGGADPCLRPFPAGGWRAFDGLWGSRGCASRRSCTFARAPQSPWNQVRSKFPWCYKAGGRQRCDGTPAAR